MHPLILLCMLTCLDCSDKDPESGGGAWIAHRSLLSVCQMLGHYCVSSQSTSTVLRLSVAFCHDSSWQTVNADSCGNSIAYLDSSAHFLVMTSYTFPWPIIQDASCSALTNHCYSPHTGLEVSLLSPRFSKMELTDTGAENTSCLMCLDKHFIFSVDSSDTNICTIKPHPHLTPTVPGLIAHINFSFTWPCTIEGQYHSHDATLLWKQLGGICLSLFPCVLL